MRHQGSLGWPQGKNRHLGKKYIYVDQDHHGYEVGIWKPSGRKKSALIHNISRIIGTNSIQIQVIGTIEKNPQLWLFRANRLE